MKKFVSLSLAVALLAQPISTFAAVRAGGGFRAAPRISAPRVTPRVSTPRVTTPKVSVPKSTVKVTPKTTAPTLKKNVTIKPIPKTMPSKPASTYKPTKVPASSYHGNQSWYNPMFLWWYLFLRPNNTDVNVNVQSPASSSSSSSSSK